MINIFQKQISGNTGTQSRGPKFWDDREREEGCQVQTDTFQKGSSCKARLIWEVLHDSSSNLPPAPVSGVFSFVTPRNLAIRLFPISTKRPGSTDHLSLEPECRTGPCRLPGELWDRQWKLPGLYGCRQYHASHHYKSSRWRHLLFCRHRLQCFWN